MTAKLGKVEIYNKGPPDKKRCISTSVRTMAKKLDRVVGSNAGLLSPKSHNLLSRGHIMSYNK